MLKLDFKKNFPRIFKLLKIKTWLGFVKLQSIINTKIWCLEHLEVKLETLYFNILGKKTHVFKTCNLANILENVLRMYVKNLTKKSFKFIFKKFIKSKVPIFGKRKNQAANSL